MHTCKIGDSVLWSTVHNGLIRAKFIGIRDSQFFGTKRCIIKLTSESGPYKIGEVIDASPTFVTPKAVFKKTGLFTYIATDEYQFEGES